MATILDDLVTPVVEVPAITWKIQVENAGQLTDIGVYDTETVSQLSDADVIARIKEYYPIDPNIRVLDWADSQVDDNGNVIEKVAILRTKQQTKGC